MRVRGAHFDHFGGAYVDLYKLDDAANMYTAGYMLPLSTEDGTLFFPSLNYTYIDYQTNDLAKVMSAQTGSNIDSGMVNTMLGGDDSHLASLNLYALKPWNETHFSVAQINLGQAYGGVDMNVANIMWIQGIKTKVADKDFNIMFEFKYDVFEMEENNGTEMKSDEFTASIGLDYRF